MFLSFSVLDCFSVINFFGFCLFLVHSTVASVLLSVLLSASVERFDVSCMRDFHRIGPLGRFNLVVAMSVCCPYVCLSPFHVLDF